MSKTCNFVYGCSVFRSSKNGSCPYCYARYKNFGMQGLTDKDFLSPKYYPEKLEAALSQSTQELFVGSIMGDFLSPDITDENLIDIFSKIQSHPQHLFMVLSKNTPRYIDFFKNVWKEKIPRNVWCGTSIENEYYRKRADWLRELKDFDPDCHIWIESEPTIGFHNKTDFSGIDYLTVSLLGEDMIYTSQQGKRFSSYFKEEWILSLFTNPTLDTRIMSIWEGVTRKCKSPIILNHYNYSMYYELHKLNGKIKDKEIKTEFNSLW